MLPFNVLSFSYLLYALLSLGAGTAEQFTALLRLLFHRLFGVFFEFGLVLHVFIRLGGELLEELFIDFFEVFDVVLRVVEQIEFLVREFIELLLADFQLQSQLIFYLFASKSTPALRRSSVSYLCSIPYRFEYS